MNRFDAAQGLRRAGLVRADAVLEPLTAARLAPVSRALQVAIAIGAWLASTLALSVHVPILFLDDGAAVPAAIGVALCGLAAWTNRRRDHGRPPEAGELFRDHLMLTIGLCGIGLLASALLEWGGYRTGVAWLGLVLALVLVVINPEPMHRFAVAALALGLAAWLVRDHLGWVALPPWQLALVLSVWLGQARWSRLGGHLALGPVGTATTLAWLVLIVVLGGPVLPVPDRGAEVGVAMQGSIAVAALISFVVLRRRGAGTGRRTPADAAPVDAAPVDAASVDVVVLAAAVTAAVWCILRAPAIAGCLLAWALTLASGHRRLALLALVTLAVHLAFHYYGLETTLMDKGLALLEMAAAAALVPLAVLWRRPPSAALGRVGRGG